MDSIQWYQNKIKGGFAEEVCKSHFGYLGYDVANTGIEHIAPQYTKYTNRIDTLNNEVKKVLQKSPDLLISNDKKAFLVEVKFNGNIKSDPDFYSYGKELLFNYRYMLFRCNRLAAIDNMIEFIEEIDKIENDAFENELCENFIFYVVLNNIQYNSYVHVFIPSLYKTKLHGLAWRNAYYNHINEILDIEDFNKGYRDVVHPILENLFENKSLEEECPF